MTMTVTMLCFAVVIKIDITLAIPVAFSDLDLTSDLELNPEIPQVIIN